MTEFELTPDKEMDNEFFTYIPSEERDFDIDIYMPAYQHEKYVAQAIESVLMQETGYRYRILIGEDCSSDGTREIILKYWEKHRDKIALLLWKKNTHSFGIIHGRVGRCLCVSKYYAVLECDDYWIDKKKIEKQVSLLEEHPEYIACVHNVIKVDEEGKVLHRDYSQYPIKEEHIITRQDAIEFKHEFQTATMVMRNLFRDWDRKRIEKYFDVEANGDRKNFTLFCLKGDIYFFREAMSAYRRTYNGSSYNANIAGHNQSYKIYSDCYNISEYIKEEMDIDIPTGHICFMCWTGALQIAAHELNKENLQVFGKLTKALISRHRGYFFKRIGAGFSGR